MAKKDFSTINTGRVYEAIADATAEPVQEVQEKQETKKKYKPRKTYTEQEAQEFISELKTTGRKGLKMPRINMAFSPEIYDYIQTMARVSGITLTEFVNLAMKQHKEEHKDLYEKAVEFRNSL